MGRLHILPIVLWNSLMAWKDLPFQVKVALLDHYERGTLTDEVIAGVSMKRGTLERILRFFRTEYRGLLQHQAAQVQFPESPSKRYVDFETIYSDDVIVISDCEVPDFDSRYLKYALLTAMAHNIKHLVIAGDFIATDQPSLTAWLNTYRSLEDGEDTYENAVTIARRILDEFGKWFETITVIEGNHDDRIARVSGGEVHLGMFITGDKVKYSRYQFLHVQTSRGLVKIVHPRNYSQNPITLAQQLYDVEQVKCHVVIGHCHRMQSGVSKDGLFEVHALGTGRDSTRTKYRGMSVSKLPQWDKSFLMIRRAHFYPLHLTFSDWRFVLGDLYDASQK